jgi:hypothetical protein
MGSPTTRAFPEFSFTAEDMKKFISKIKIIIKRLSLIIRSLNAYTYSNKKFYSKAYIMNKR